MAKKLYKWFIGLSFLAIVVLIYLSGWHKLFRMEELRHHAGTLLQYTHTHYWRMVTLYLMLFVTATVFFIPVTVLFSIVSGFLFGVVMGTILTVLGATVGAVLLFFFVRFLFGAWVQKKYNQQLQRFNYEISAHGPRYLLALQWLPFTPTPLINLLAGVSPISWWPFTWSTALGVLPGTVVYAWMGYQMRFVHTPTQGVLLVVSIILTLVAIMLVVPLLLRWVKK